jgi:hypothetical protein
MEGAMYGTVFHMQPKIGTEDEVVRLMEQWARDRGPKVAGFVSSNLFKLDNGGMMGVAIFESKEKYDANANDPDQDRWFRRLRELLESDPEWNDGEVIQQVP